MNTLSVSSYSVREHLGSTSFTFINANGDEQTFASDFPKLLDVSDFPGRAVDVFGVRAVETVGFQFTGVDDPEIDRFAEALSAAGVGLLNVAVDVGDLLEQDDAKRAVHIAEMARWVDRFAALGSRFVRVNPGSPFSTHHGDTPPATLVDALRELGARATSRGTRLLVENHGGPSSDPVWMNGLLDAVGVEYVGLLLDLGNFDALLGPLMQAMFAEPGSPAAAGGPFDGLDLTSLYAGIDALAARAELVHVKAHHVGDDGTIGAVDLDRALGILLDHGYTGPLTIEYEGTGGDPWEKTKRVLDLTARIATRTEEN